MLVADMTNELNKITRYSARLCGAVRRMNVGYFPHGLTKTSPHPRGTAEVIALLAILFMCADFFLGGFQLCQIPPYS